MPRRPKVPHTQDLVRRMKIVLGQQLERLEHRAAGSPAAPSGRGTAARRRRRAANLSPMPKPPV